MRIIALSVALAACTPYSPTLGGEPFLCGSAAPQCPDGYTCKMDSTGKMVCASQNGGATVDSAPAGFQCADDSAIEGTTHDDSVMTAYNTPVTSQGRKNVSFAGLAICPATDKDFFRVDLNATTQNLEAIVTYDDPSKMGAGPLKMSIDNSSGVPLQAATLVTGSPNTIRAYIANLPMNSSPYYIEVEGDGTSENNYKLDINVTP
jgi:hypothetical protein